MSLFQVREWWSVKGESCEEYTHGALVVGNVDNDTSGQGACAVIMKRNARLHVYMTGHC